MTTPTTRLAEIAERQAEQQAFEAWAREASPFAGGDGRLYARAGFKAGWSAQLTAAQARSREDAEIMREAAALIDRPSRKFVIAARLRTRADELEGGAR